VEDHVGITLRFQLTDDELGRVARLALIERTRFRVTLAVCILAGVGAFVLGLWQIGLFDFVFVSSLFIRFLLVPASTGKRIKRMNPFLGEMRTWTFGEDGIEARGTSQSSTWVWASIDRVEERGGTIYLQVKGGSQRIAIPLRVFDSSGEQTKFRELTGLHLGTASA
jgi:hypothetical protein